MTLPSSSTSPPPTSPRSAIVGTGFMGDVHARAVRAAGGTVAAVVSRDADRAAHTAHRWGANAYSSLTAALATGEVDVVHICTPNHTHLDLAREAIAAGVHVICEKPLATTVSDARELATAARTAGIVHAVPFAYRFYGSVREARARVAAAPSVRLVHGTYLQDWLSRAEETNWRVDPRMGGRSRAFADIGVHWCDLAEFVTGDRIVQVSAQLLAIDRPGSHTGGPDGTPATEDAAVIQFATRGGAVGSAVISQVSPGRKNRLWLSVDTADASYEFDQENPDSLWIGGRTQSVVLPRGAEAQTIGPHYDLVPTGHPQGYQDCFTHLVRDVHAAMDGETPDGLPTFDDGVRAAVLTEAVLESADGGRWVDVPMAADETAAPPRPGTTRPFPTLTTAPRRTHVS